MQEALRHPFRFSWRGVCWDPVTCALRLTSVGVFSDMLSKCEKDGLVPKAKPRNVSDFSFMPLQPSPSAPAHIRDPG